jgi:kynurenine formamidase
MANPQKDPSPDEGRVQFDSLNCEIVDVDLSKVEHDNTVRQIRESLRKRLKPPYSDQPLPGAEPLGQSPVVRRLIDVSHVVEDGLVTYPGLPAPLVCDFLSREASRAVYADGTTFQIAKIEMVANTGTYVDSPFHRFADGADLAALELSRLADLDGLVVDATGRGRNLGPEVFDGLDVRGKAVLVRTGWDAHWATPAYAEGHPFLTRAAAELLREAGAVLVGIDSLNIDDTRDGTRPAHTALLGAGIPVAEHLCNLGALPSAGFRFHAAPVKFRGVGTFPVRAYGIVGP